jgi:hypothetical protein
VDVEYRVARQTIISFLSIAADAQTQDVRYSGSWGMVVFTRPSEYFMRFVVQYLQGQVLVLAQAE